MFNFVKKIKEMLVQPKETVPSVDTLGVSKKILAEEERQLKELLDGKDSYKIFYWVFIYKDKGGDTDRLIPLREWKDVEDILDRLDREYDRIDTGRLLIEIKDDNPDYMYDEIASLQIQIAHGYMRPYLKYREEGAEYAEEWKWYWAEEPWEDGDDLEFEHDLYIPLFHLTKDINIVKTIFKEFYETGDVSEKYMD